MTENQIAKCRQRLERFLLDLLEPIGRSERRHWGELYVRGLLQDGERKSIEPMAARLPDGNVQAMQQFVGQSPWAWQEVWARLEKRMTAELEPDSAWVVDDTGFPKQGEESVGVDRQYSGTLGKTGSCQVAVSFCDLPPSYKLRRMVRITKCRWKIEQDYHQLKEELGLDHYEGRSWNGWRHHVTLVMLAHAFPTLETLRSNKNFWVDPADNTCSSLGRATAPTAELQWAIREVLST